MLVIDLFVFASPNCGLAGDLFARLMRANKASPTKINRLIRDLRAQLSFSGTGKPTTHI